MRLRQYQKDAWDEMVSLARKRFDSGEELLADDTIIAVDECMKSWGPSLSQEQYDEESTQACDEDPHVACYSYPMCDEDPNGCVVLCGDDAETYGHRD